MPIVPLPPLTSVEGGSTPTRALMTPKGNQTDFELFLLNLFLTEATPCLVESPVNGEDVAALTLPVDDPELAHYMRKNGFDRSNLGQAMTALKWTIFKEFFDNSNLETKTATADFVRVDARQRDNRHQIVFPNSDDPHSILEFMEKPENKAKLEDGLKQHVGAREQAEYNSVGHA